MDHHLNRLRQLDARRQHCYSFTVYMEWTDLRHLPSTLHRYDHLPYHRQLDDGMLLPGQIE